MPTASAMQLPLRFWQRTAAAAAKPAVRCRQLATRCLSTSTSRRNSADSTRPDSDSKTSAHRPSAIQSIRGVHDHFPPTTTKLQHIESMLSSVAKRYGYSELRVPIIERAELFDRSVGQGSDIVQKEMYSWRDRDEQTIVLRPEATASVARACIERGMLPQSPTQRYYYCGPMFRRERPQAGRYRQFQQFGVECIANSSVQADVEVILLAQQALQQLGIPLPSVELQINSLGDVNDRQAYSAVLHDWLQQRRYLLSADSQLRLDRASALRILDSKDKGDQQVLAGTHRDLQLREAAPLLDQHLSTASKDRFSSVLRTLDSLQVTYTVNPLLVRGLDYYTHTTFEFVTLQSDLTTAATTGSHGSTLLAGGRYDGLYHQLGGPSNIAAIGWAAGVERLMLAMPDTSFASSEANYAQHVYPISMVAGIDDAARVERIEHCLQQLIFQLRQAGVAVLPPHANSKLKLSKQLHYADKNYAGLQTVLIMGTDEVDDGTVQIKNLQTGDQRCVSTSRALEELCATHKSTTAPR